MKFPRELKAIIFIVNLFISCGSRGEELKPKTPWEPSLSEYFDDSVDFTLNPQLLSGEWLRKYEDQLSMRLLRSEFILALKINSITKKSDADGRECKDIFAVVKSRVKGEWKGDTITLRVCDNEAGFDSFKEEDSRLFERIYIAFIKLARAQNGTIKLHWHLSPLSQGLKDSMNQILKESDESNKEQETKMIVH